MEKSNIMRVKHLVIVVILLFSGFIFAQNGVKGKEICINTEKCKIYGTLKVPKTKEKVPVALIIAGSGPTDRNCNSPSVGLNCNSYKILSDSLNKYGIATLCYDKRGIAKSVTKQTENEVLFEHFAEDAKAWIEFLSQDSRFSEIVVIGHSEGSLVGMLACQNNHKVSKFISIAGIGSSADEMLKEQSSKQLESMPELKKQFFYCLDELKQGRLLEKVPAEFSVFFRPSGQPYLISLFKYNPQEEIAKLKIPVLILQGDMDIQVSEDEAELLHEANPNAKKVIIENMNHVLKNSETIDLNEQLKDSYNNPNSAVNKELVKEIIFFYVNSPN